MWVVFWMTRAKVDIFAIHETEEEARSEYEILIDQDDTYCAGYAPIKKSTDWTPTI
jgi:hypothetical protein